MGDNNENDRVTSPESVPIHLMMSLHSDACCKTKCQAIILVMVRGLDMLHVTDLCHEMCISGVTQWHMLHNICVMQSVSPCINPNLMCHEIHVYVFGRFKYMCCKVSLFKGYRKLTFMFHELLDEFFSKNFFQRYHWFGSLYVFCLFESLFYA